MEKYNFKENIDELKKKDKLYLKELQLFFDKVDNVSDQELKSQILYQMHRCEQRIICMCEQLINKWYKYKNKHFRKNIIK